jgi:hypothetical protein
LAESIAGLSVIASRENENPEEYLPRRAIVFDGPVCFVLDALSAIILVKEYADEGKTGTNLKRSGYEALYRDAQDGKFDAVS